MNIWWTYDKHDMYEMMISMLRVLFILLTLLVPFAGNGLERDMLDSGCNDDTNFCGWEVVSYVCEVDSCIPPGCWGRWGRVSFEHEKSILAASSRLQHPSSLFSQDTKSTGFQKFASTHSKGSTTRFVASSWWNVDGGVRTKKPLKQGWNNSKTLNISAHLGRKISGNQAAPLQPGRARTFTDSASDVSDTWRIDLGLVNNVGQQPTNNWIDSPRRYGWWPKSCTTW